METVVSETFETCREALTGERPHRVWSLIITIFGDMAQGEGMSLSGGQLAQITDAIGIKPEAMRVALHRLRKDGWIDSRRDGRSRRHALTAFGREQCAEANARIYGPGLPPDTPVHLLIAEDHSAEARPLLDAYALTDSYVQIGGNTLIGLGEPPEDCEGLLMVVAAELSVPDWMRSRICDGELVTESANLAAGLETVRKLLTGRTLDRLETEALRVLVVHSWRRLVFRHPNLPARFFPEDWRGQDCRDLVREILAQLPLETPQTVTSP